jgi:acyl-CoA thioester hydrolase
LTLNPSPLCVYRNSVQPEWLDVNDHMNTAYYALVFDQAAEAFMASLGVDEAYIADSNASWVALESHTTFGRELRLADRLRVEARVLDADAKRIHLFQALHHDGLNFQAASNELMIMHLDLKQRRSSPFPDAVAARLDALLRDQRELPPPPEKGSVIGIRRATR